MQQQLFLYLDESGDLGFEFAKQKTSKYFVITVLISNEPSIFKYSVKRTLKNKMNHKNKKRMVYELKGSETDLARKIYFYNLLKDNTDWFIHTIVLDKRDFIKSGNSSLPKEELYNILCKEVLAEIEVIKNADILHLYVDKSKTPQEIQRFDRDLKLHLEKVLSVDLRLNIEHLCSKENSGLQSVDMFCYGISKKYEVDDSIWYKCFKDRIKGERIFSPKKRRPLKRSLSLISSSQPMEGST